MLFPALFLLAFLPQEQPEILLRQKDVMGWTALGEGAEMRAAAGALVYSYDVAPKKLAGTVIGAPEGFARMHTIRFAITSDHDTAFGVLLSEKKPGGGNYAAWFWAPANVRQLIELTPADFTITDGTGDPVDTDGKLDLDQVEGIGILDLAQFFLSLPRNNAVPVAVAQQPGRHTMTIEDFTVSTAEPTRTRVSKGVLDGFERDFLDWVAVGGMKLQVSPSGNPLGARAMQASYRQREGQLELLVRRVGEPAFAHAKRLSFDIASEREVTLVVALEMKKQSPGGGEGPRFSVPIYPPGGKEIFHVDLDLADFKGPDGVFDPAQWRTIAIVDATTAEGGAEQENTIWIGKMEARD